MNRLTFIILVVIETILIIVAKWPNIMYFQAYAFGDQGANLTIFHLLKNGWIPTIDFNYIYGLLAILFNEFIFICFGCTPLVYAITTSILSVVLVIILAIIITHPKTCLSEQFLFMAALPFVIYQMPPLSFAHILESIFISLAIYMQIRNKIQIALLFIIISVSVKPALGYVYGLLLSLQLISYGIRENKSFIEVVYKFLPSVFIILLVLVILSIRYGITPLLNTLLPFNAQQVYKYENFGFFTGQGRIFWNPPGANYRYYLGNPVGFWLVATIVLNIAIFIIIIKYTNYVYMKYVVISISVLHNIFIFIAFGHNYSWTYYMYLLIIGTILLIKYTKSNKLYFILLILAIMGNYAEFRGIIHMWKNRDNYKSLNNMYSTKDFIIEWLKILNISNERRTFMLTYIGALFIIEPNIDSTHAWCLYHWMATPTEKIDLIKRIGHAQVVIIPMHNIGVRHLPESGKWVADILSEFPYVTELKHFRILSRTPLSIKHGD
ncbi:MAG: hypothetical protein NZZ41_07455 [Candidatus Dojkabacteria bacterium]|nr:hypothetical protein [Candidatus Dojkabacteria bacterium]